MIDVNFKTQPILKYKNFIFWIPITKLVHVIEIEWAGDIWQLSGIFKVSIEIIMPRWKKIEEW